MSCRIIEMNGALPVPDEMKTCVRSSSGSSMNLPLGPIIRIPWPTGRSPQQRRERPALDEPDVELVALVAGTATAARPPNTAAGGSSRPTITPIVMYWPGSNGVGSPSKRTQKLGERLGLVLAPDETGVVDGCLRDRSRGRGSRRGRGGQVGHCVDGTCASAAGTRRHRAQPEPDEGRGYNRNLPRTKAAPPTGGAQTPRSPPDGHDRRIPHRARPPGREALHLRLGRGHGRGQRRR